MNALVVYLLLAGAGFSEPKPSDAEPTGSGWRELTRQFREQTNQQPATILDDPAAPAPGKSEAPVVKIKVPEIVMLGHMVHVVFEVSGGPIREWETLITPQLDPDDVDDKDQKHIMFTAEAGTYTIDVLCIGRDKGYAKQQAKVVVRDPRPPVAAATAKAQAAEPLPKELILQWVSEVNSKNRDAEKLDIAANGRDIADEISKPRADASRPAEKWASRAYLNMGPTAFAPWNMAAPGGKSFFVNVGELLAANKEGAGDQANQANLIRAFCDYLEGKQ